MGAVVKKIAIGAALVGSAFIPGLPGILAPMLLSLGASTVLGGIAQALRKPQSGSLLNDLQGRLTIIKQAAAARRVIYGFARVGEVLSFANVFGLPIAPTDQNQFVLTIAGHAIDSFQGVYFDDEAPEVDLTSGIGLGVWYGKVFIQRKLGYDGDAAFPSLPNESRGIWTADHRQRGCAGAYVRLNYSAKLYPNGVPNITFLVNGKPVFDPRLNSPITIIGATNATPIVIEATGHGFVGGEVVRILSVGGNTAANGSAWGVDFVDANHFSLQGSAGNAAYTGGGQIFKLGWSKNAALVIADYLWDPWIGMGVPYGKIRSAVLIAAANVCDEPITLPDASTENRYTINGTYETSEQHGEILAQMANAMAGHVTHIGGEWHIIPGAFRLPVMELTDADVVAPMQVETKRSRRDLFNGIKGTFPSAAHNFVETDFPAIAGATYLAEDQGVRVWKDIFLPFTITATAAQRIAAIELERNRRQISLQMTCSMRAYELQPGDVVEFTHSRYSWALETFEVAECGLQQTENGALVVTLQLVQTDVDVYGFAVNDYGNLIDPDLLDLLSRKVPFGWSPGIRSGPGWQDPTDYSFGIVQDYELAADGSMRAKLVVAGFPPVNLFSGTISRPRTKNLVATTAASGGFLDGGQRYYIGVCGIDDVSDWDAAGRRTALSEIAVVDVPAGSDLNTVTIHDLLWHSSTAGWFLVFGTDKHRLSNQAGAGYFGTLGSSVTVTGPPARPTSITFKGYNAPANLPKGYFVHLRGAPDHRFSSLVIRVKHALSLGCFGGGILSVPDSTHIQLEPSVPFTPNVFAGRYIGVIGDSDPDLPLGEGGGMPLADVLIDSNDGDTVSVPGGHGGAANGFIPGNLVAIRTKATSVGSDTNGNYIEDTGYLQDPGAVPTNAIGNQLRIIDGPGTGDTYLLKNVIDQKFYPNNEWVTTPTTASIFIIEEPGWMVEHFTSPLEVEREKAIPIEMEAPNILGMQFLVMAFTRSAAGIESAERDCPYRMLNLYGQVDAGRVVTTATTLTLLDRYVRGDTSDIGSPPTPNSFTITCQPPSALPGMEVLIENIGTSGNILTVVVAGGSLMGGLSSIDLVDGEAILIRARSDP